MHGAVHGQERKLKEEEEAKQREKERKQEVVDGAGNCRLRSHHLVMRCRSGGNDWHCN